MARKLPTGARSKLIKVLEAVVELGEDGKRTVTMATRRVRNTSLRLRYLGKTPGKGSATGRKVIARMKAEGKIVGEPPMLKWRDPVTGERDLIELSKCDMGHHPEDAVDWWNRKGYMYGAKSPEARAFMLDPDNYELQPSSWNRSQGAMSGKSYVAPGSAFLD